MCKDYAYGQHCTMKIKETFIFIGSRLCLVAPNIENLRSSHSCTLCTTPQRMTPDMLVRMDIQWMLFWYNLPSLMYVGHWSFPSQGASNASLFLVRPRLFHENTKTHNRKKNQRVSWPWRHQWRFSQKMGTCLHDQTYLPVYFLHFQWLSCCERDGNWL